MMMLGEREHPGAKKMACQPSWKLWGGVAACMVAVGWLLPNHHPPYSTFHTDAWVSAVLALVAVVPIVASRESVQWHGISLLVAAVVLVPLLQLAVGTLAFAGDAWISSLYLLGLLISILVGARWQRWRRDGVGDFLFFAFAIASLASVGLQLYQWLGFSDDDGVADIWALYLQGSRPYANLGQPNQLATLLLWGLLANLWGFVRGYVRLPIAMLGGSFIVIGIAMTQSRTAWLATAVLTVGCWYFRATWKTRAIPWLMVFYAALLAFVSLSLGVVSRALSVDVSPDFIGRFASGVAIRPAAWSMFFDAALKRPWFGYGWNQLHSAQLSVIEHHPVLRGLLFAQSHNLVLDLVLWMGFPIGFAITFFLAVWFWRRFTSVSRPEDLLLLMALVVVAGHAMLEFPLHYAYFLLPSGLLLGALNAETGARLVLETRRRVLGGVWLCGVTIFGIVIYDYSHVEPQYFAMRFREKHIGRLAAVEPPAVLLLTNLREVIRFSGFEPKMGMTVGELQWARDVAGESPSSGNLLKVATALALNNHGDEASLWLRKICPIVSRDQCAAARSAWKRRQKSDPEILRVAWPGG